MVDLSALLGPLLSPKTANALESAFGMTTIGDLLAHYPRRYVSRSVLTPLAELEMDEYVTVMAEVKNVQVIPNRNQQARGRKSGRLIVDVTDGSADLRLTFFGQAWRAKELKSGVRGLFAGKVGAYGGHKQLTHPDYLIVQSQSSEGQGEFDASEPTGLAEPYISSVIPVYPATGKVTSWTLAASVSLVLAALDPVPDPIPAVVSAKHSLLDFDKALRAVHKPESIVEAEMARRRLKYAEALNMQLILLQRRKLASVQAAKARDRSASGLSRAFEERLPFQLTPGQQNVAKELSTDLASPHPMHRLLQGDVGSGKTILALIAMLQVVDAQGQCVLLSPTEVLAQQHYRVITGLLGDLGQAGMLGGAGYATRVVLLTASLSGSERKAALAAIGDGSAGIIVGTHSVLSSSVKYADLGLVVIDEQHRFGVEQRAALTNREAGLRPHLLAMTATPIPRTIAITVFGDLATSTLAEKPPGRQEIATHVVGEHDPNSHMSRVWERVFDEVKSGRQVYVVCPSIGDSHSTESGSDAEALHSVTEVVDRLSERVLPNVRVAALHGRMTDTAKQDIMARFAQGPLTDNGIDLIVSTTVIEVGIDVPNASTIVILNADRFGISQLHQLRGRVGRGTDPGLCLLVTTDLPDSASRARLDAVASTTDGFELARTDLAHRREGDVLGALQSGRRSSLKLLSVLVDGKLIEQARSDAAEILDGDPQLVQQPLLAAGIAMLQDETQPENLAKS
jgi:ATP-dependent DNA helicase RecG